MRTASRLLAALLVLGQLQSLPAALACAHRQAPSAPPCHQSAPVERGQAVAALAAAEAPQGSCGSQMPCCALRGGMAAADDPVSFLVVGPAAAVAVADQAAPPSHVVAPSPPPPQG